ncbi:MAG TPA: glucose-6-phosphate dehydrogenase, partial [Rhodothermia bacterium]|nr:glucose-6-phosphate dehydrogenase [Rhodothermia bacterium]
QCLHYCSIGAGGPEAFAALSERIARLETEYDLPGDRTFYLALPPQAFPPTIEGLGNAGLHRSHGHTRLVIEKPFGHDLASARALNELLHRYFDESQIYRIDHYLGKETVQNLLVFRFANPVFESVWNRDRVESVEITVAESLGIETRAGYYDRAGALRDMVQNHLTQLLALTAMEVPTTFKADPIRNEKVKVLHSLVPPTAGDVVFGQYVAGRVDGASVPGYLEEEGVPQDSRTETFAALRLHIDNWRWQGVPFYIRTGKRLEDRKSQIVVKFRSAPVSLFRDYQDCKLHSNVLVLSLQPDEGFELQFDVKAPGQDITLRRQRLHFEYAEAFRPLPDAYETLLFDIVTNDQTLFVRADEVESSWQLFGPLLDPSLPRHPYEAGSSGPREIGRIFSRLNDVHNREG